MARRFDESKERVSAQAFTIKELAGEVRRLRSALTRVEADPVEAARIAREALR
jgi:hypothetical protein